MTHPDYPSRALTREWRVTYKRVARRLIVLFAVALLCAVVGCWAVVMWAGGRVASAPDGPRHPVCAVERMCR